MKENILAQSYKNAGWLTNIRRTLHSMPETGFDTIKTAAFVTGTLQELGISFKNCGRSGIIATIGAGEPVFLLRSDMDGLPVREETGLPFASVNGNMHACGHDMHTAMLLGAAKLLKEREAQLPGTVKLMFQSAEEILEGAKDMIAAGLLEDPRPEAGMMLHVMTAVPLPIGAVTVCGAGISAPGAEYFRITVRGKGCHGAMPHTGIDPIGVAARIVTGLQEIRAMELSLSDDAILTIGTLQAGNSANVIPDTAALSGSLRAFDEDVLALMKDRVTAIVKGTADAFRAEAEVGWGPACPPLENDPGLSSAVYRWTTDLLGQERVMTQQELMQGASGRPVRSSGSEDFAYVSQQIPTIMVSLAAGSPEEGHAYPLHHPKVTFDEDALPIGAAVLANTAVRWLEGYKGTDCA